MNGSLVSHFGSLFFSFLCRKVWLCIVSRWAVAGQSTSNIVWEAGELKFMSLDCWGQSSKEHHLATAWHFHRERRYFLRLKSWLMIRSLKGSVNCTHRLRPPCWSRWTSTATWPWKRCLPGVCGRQRTWAQPPRTTGLHRVAETQRPTKWIPVFYVSISCSCHRW